MPRFAITTTTFPIEMSDTYIVPWDYEDDDYYWDYVDGEEEYFESAHECAKFDGMPSQSHDVIKVRRWVESQPKESRTQNSDEFDYTLAAVVKPGEQGYMIPSVMYHGMCGTIFISREV